MERALKYTFIALVAIVVVVIGLVYGLYFSGARNIPAAWGPTKVQYPEATRLALWRSYGGEGAPEGNPMSPPEYVWQWYRARQALIDHAPVDPRTTMASRAARPARFMARGGHGNRLLADVAATIQASRWPVEQQLDTVLDNSYFAEGVRGFQQGAMHVFGQPLEQLDDAQLHVLLTVDWAPSAVCVPHRLRKLAIAKAEQWNAPVSTWQLEGALAKVLPAFVDRRCAGN